MWYCYSIGTNLVNFKLNKNSKVLEDNKKNSSVHCKYGKKLCWDFIC